MGTSRRHFLQLAALGSTSLAFPHLSFAQRADTAVIVGGFAAGGTVDTLARRAAQGMGGDYANTVVVETRAGAGGQIAVQAVTRAAPDGRTLLVTPMSMLGIYPHTYKNLSYKPLEDLAPVSLGCVFDFGFAVGPAVPASVKDVPGFLAWARENPNQANFGSPAAGSVPHFVGELIGRAGDARLQHVAFRGSQPAIVDMMGGQIAAVSAPIGEFLPHISTGKVRVLGASGKERNRFMPEVPTLVEQGMKDMVYGEWFGFFLPKGTPADTVERANASLVRALKAKEVVEGLALMGLEARSSTPKELDERLRGALEFWGPVIKEIGFTADA